MMVSKRTQAGTVSLSLSFISLNLFNRGDMTFYKEMGKHLMFTLILKSWID